MNSAIVAYEDGFLSYSDMLENLASNGGEINEMRKFPSVVANMDGNTLNIVVYANVASVETRKGNVFENAGDIECTRGVTFGEALRLGIESWSGAIDGININVKAVIGNSNTHKTIKATYVYGLSTSSVANGSDFTVKYLERLDENDKWLENFVNTNAHEIAHSAFNIKDAYDCVGGIITVMQRGVPPAVQSIDRAILYEAYKTGFKETYYNSYPNALEKYAPGYVIFPYNQNLF